MLTFSRQLAKQIRSVFRRALQISASQTDQVVWLVGDESGLCFRAQNWRATAEYHLSGPAPTESIPITMEALAACEGTKADELVTVERGSEGVVVLRWTDRSIPQSFQLDAQKIRADQTPVLPEAWASNPPRLLKALCDAMTIAASDATRFAIDCVQLRSDGGRIAATDSHQLLIESGFNFPGNSDLLISRTTLFGFKELPADQPVDVGVTANHGVFRVGAWTFWLTLEKQGRYPNVENIIPAAGHGEDSPEPLGGGRVLFIGCRPTTSDRDQSGWPCHARSQRPSRLARKRRRGDAHHAGCAPELATHRRRGAAQHGSTLPRSRRAARVSRD